MTMSPEVLHALRTVAHHLGGLRDRVVFVGGAVRAFLVSDPAVEGSRATKDVDVIAAGIATLPDYYAHVVGELQKLGFKQDTSENAPLCRWKVAGTVVDVMPPISDVLGFSNRWYEQAVERADTHVLPAGAGFEAMKIRVVNAPLFLATKLEAFKGRGKGDYQASHDIEDLVALIDGRPSLVDEVERESDELRSYLATELSTHLPAGLEEAIEGHLSGDAASQQRRPMIACALDRVRRRPTRLSFGDVVQSKIGGDPGASNTPGPWRYEITSARRFAEGAPTHVYVHARLTSMAKLAGTVGDGRNVHIEDARGRLFKPLYKLLDRSRRALEFPETHDQIVPDEPFKTCWVYELPRDAKGLRLLLPFGGYELPLDEILFVEIE